MEDDYYFEHLKFLEKNITIKFKKLSEFNAMKIKKKLFVFLIIITAINLSYIINDLSKDIYFIGNKRKESYTINDYFRLCNEGKLINKKKFKKIENPKISIVSPVYNRENYILRFLRSIQNQFFEDIEIIFIDDFSYDNSVKIIRNYQKEDERIILLKHNKNKGTLISRNEGILKSKGEYIIIPDPDDILSQNILKLCYEIVQKYQIEMIRFNMYIGKGKIFFDNIVNDLESKIILQPELSTYMFYGKGFLQQIDFNLSNKFIKRTAYINSLNSLDEYYLKSYLINMEDRIINYSLYRNVKSLYFLKKIGYFYIQNKESITINYYKNYDETLKSLFFFLKFVFENSKNNKYEKDIANEVLKQFSIAVNVWLNFITKDFQFYLKIINMYLNSEYISKENKIKLKEYKLKLEIFMIF